jgi:uncharacterized protein
MEKRNNVGVWFEIPVVDMGRARSFYERLLGVELKLEDVGAGMLAVFPYRDETGTSGCLIEGGFAGKPSSEGATVYLNADGVLAEAMGRAPAIGGSVVSPVIDLPDGMGRFVLIRDTEGNRIGLHEAA